MAILKKESILELIENAQAVELKLILREILKSDEGTVLKSISELYEDKTRSMLMCKINGTSCSKKDAMWIAENITESEYIKFADSIDCSKLYEAGEVQALAIQSFAKFSELQSFGRLQNIVSILYKGLGGKRKFKVLMKFRVTYIGFKEDEKYEGLFRTLKDCKEVKGIYESRTKVKQLEADNCLGDLI